VDTEQRGPSGEAGRPVELLPLSHLLRLSAYWLGLTAVFGGIGLILQERIDELVAPDVEGAALGLMQIAGVAIAVVVQPTVGSISDYTISRFGRRKPYILIGSLLDVVFLFGIATSQTYLSVTAFLVLLQFSSNFAQGPFQGYVPDLVPARQVGLASALVGLFTVFGIVTGAVMAAVGTATGDFFWPTMALGLIEVTTMLALFFRLDEGRRAKDRGGRPWRAIAAEAWATDVLRERSFLFLVGSRFFILGATAFLFNLAVKYLERGLGIVDPDERAVWEVGTLVAVVAATALATIPAARLSDRIGRKRVIYLACLVGSIGMTIVAFAPSPMVAVPGAIVVGIGAGAFLAVDWALMTDIIPKAESGRYMGLSNVATATNGVIVTLIGGLIIDAFFRLGEPSLGARLAMLSAVAWFAVGALLLRPVDERRREDLPIPTPAVAPEPATLS
jgi:MFS family permease